MIIRDAVYDDIDNIAKLYISNWKETYKGLLSEDYLNGLTKEYAVEKWSKYLKNENHVFVAYEENEFLGRGVSFCATCDGSFFKGKNVMVVGSGNTALQYVLYLSKNG